MCRFWPLSYLISYGPATSSRFISKNAFSMEPFLLAQHCPVLTHLSIPTAHCLHLSRPATSPYEASPLCRTRLTRQDLEDIVSRKGDYMTCELYYCLVTDSAELKHFSWTLGNTLKVSGKFSLVLSHLCTSHTSYHLLIVGYLGMYLAPWR